MQTVPPPRSPTPRADAPLHVVINAASGSDDADEVLGHLKARLRDSGRPFHLHPVDAANGLPAAAADAVRHAADDGGVVVAVGGDGTINAVARAAHPQRLPLAIVPQGTFNYTSRAHGIPLDLDAAIDVVLHGRVVPVQAGVVNGRLFLVNASIGLYPELLEDREAWKARFGRRRVVAWLAGVATLMGARRRLRLTLDHDGQRRSIDALTLVVVNNPLQVEQLGLPSAGRTGQGSLTVIAVRPVGTWRMLRLALRGAMGRLADTDDVIDFATERIAVDARRSLRHGARVKVATDGEIEWIRSPLDIDIAWTPLWLMQPREPASRQASSPHAADEPEAAPRGLTPIPLPGMA